MTVMTLGEVAENHGDMRRLLTAPTSEGAWKCNQQVSVDTLGVKDLIRSRNSYVNGFGWTPVFESKEIIFYQTGVDNR